jgi:TetR/AcrR family transcriptional regulator, transcriptional repressor for nem operon
MVRTDQMVWTSMQHHQSKARLLDATIKVVRTKGYTATRVEDVCAEAGVTKGSFFHHFKSKDDLALAALAHWKSRADDLFLHADYQRLPDPLDRLLAYVDFRKAILTGELSEYTCFAGTMLQEMYATNPEIRSACEHSICGHAAVLAADIEAAMQDHPVADEVTAESLALHMQCVIQGAFILAKAKGGAAVAADCIDHLRRYLSLLFQRPDGRPPVPARPAKGSVPGARRRR